MSYGLEKYDLKKLQYIAGKLGLKPKRKKEDCIKDIEKCFNEYEKYRKTKDIWKKKNILGEKGKEGITYLVLDNRGKKYAMKTFREKKSINKLKLEYNLQKKASEVKVAPKIYDVDFVHKWIVMEKMDSHLYDKIIKEGLNRDNQERIIEIFKKLDKIGVFHNDANITNYMLKRGKIYLIDYGFSREITRELKKKLSTETPNLKLMTIGLVLKLKEIGLSIDNYKYLLNYISDEDKKNFKLN